MHRGFQGGPEVMPMMPRDASLSNSYAVVFCILRLTAAWIKKSSNRTGTFFNQPEVIPIFFNKTGSDLDFFWQNRKWSRIFVTKPEVIPKFCNQTGSDPRKRLVGKSSLCCAHDHIPFNLKRNWNLFLCVSEKHSIGCFCLLECRVAPAHSTGRFSICTRREINFWIFLTWTPFGLQLHFSYWFSTKHNFGYFQINRISVITIKFDLV